MSKQRVVPVAQGVDLDFTPDDYFCLRKMNLLLPSDIKGQARRELMRTLAEEGEEFPADLVTPELSESERRAWGAIHPSHMGGEYLPPLLSGEVEIARISLAVSHQRPDQRSRSASRESHRLPDRRRVRRYRSLPSRPEDVRLAAIHAAARGPAGRSV